MLPFKNAEKEAVLELTSWLSWFQNLNFLSSRKSEPCGIR